MKPFIFLFIILFTGYPTKVLASGRYSSVVKQPKQSPTLKAKPYLASDLTHDNKHDIVIFINDGFSDEILPTGQDDQLLGLIKSNLKSQSLWHPRLAKKGAMVPFPLHKSNRLYFAPVGSLDQDTDDSRRIYEASTKAFRHVLSLGLDSPLLIVGPLLSAPRSTPWAESKWATLNALLAAYEVLYRIPELRDKRPNKFHSLEKLSMFNVSQEWLDIAFAIEEGRRVTRDIASGDPERMKPSNCVEYIQKEFADVSHLISIEVTPVFGNSDRYPLSAAVNRAEMGGKHSGSIVNMVYKPPKISSPSSSPLNLFLVGKGITFDSGGMNLKQRNGLVGMHRDKTGAATLAGFMKILSLLKPANLPVTAWLGFVRNSLGHEAYSVDEVITARSGKRVLVGNTDCEGRFVMADLLFEAREAALKVKKEPAHIFTVATLTSSSVKMHSPAYITMIDNGPAKKVDMARGLQGSGDLISDMAELATLRREDYVFHQSSRMSEDLTQRSSNAYRGTQSPMAFMSMVSGLDKHGSHSKTPIPYTHLDISANVRRSTQLPGTSPISMFTVHFVLPRIPEK